MAEGIDWERFAFLRKWAAGRWPDGPPPEVFPGEGYTYVDQYRALERAYRLQS